MRIQGIKFAAVLAAAVFSSSAYAQTPAPGVVAIGLDAPRGLAFGPDGTLYVAEAGRGGTSKTTSSECPQVPAPVGPYTGGASGRVSKIVGGKAVPVATGFASTQDAMGDLIGVADVAFLDGELYALVAGGGCSHGHMTLPNGVAKIDASSGKWQMIANMSNYFRAQQNQTQFENTGDFEPDGTAYSMIGDHGQLLVVEPNHGEIVSVSKQGTIARLMDVSASLGHIVPTSIAASGGAYYVGNLNLFPIVSQSAKVITVAPQGNDEPDLAPGFEAGKMLHVINSKQGFTTVVAVHFGPDGLLYALELNAADGFPGTPGRGKVVRVNANGQVQAVVGGLTVPGGMTFGPDGKLYVTDMSAVPAPNFGLGRVLRFNPAGM